MTVSTESANPRNPPNRETQTPRYLAIQFKVRFRLDARRRRGFSPAAAARHQGRSQCMRTKIWAPNSRSLSTYPNPGVDLGYMEVYVCTQIREFISGIWGPNFILTLIWTYPDGARQFRHYAPRRRAPI